MYPRNGSEIKRLQMITPAKLNSLPLKNGGWKITVLLGRPIFQGRTVKLRGGVPLETMCVCRNDFLYQGASQLDSSTHILICSTQIFGLLQQEVDVKVDKL